MMSKNDAVQSYKKLIASGNYHLYYTMPLKSGDYYFAKTLEENFDDVKKVIRVNSIKKLGCDISEEFALKSSFKVKDIKFEVPSTFSTQLFPLPLDDQFRLKILTADKFLVKTLPFQKVKNKSGRNIKVYTLYFVSKIKVDGENNYVLLKVDVIRPTEIKFGDKDAGSSVNITVKLGKHADIDLNLSRLDYKPLGSHQNFLDENNKVIPPNSDLWRRNLIFGTHIHFNSEKVQALKPSSLNSGDASFYSTSKEFLPAAKDFLTSFHFYDTNVEVTDKLNLSEIYEAQKGAKKHLSVHQLWGGDESERNFEKN